MIIDAFIVGATLAPLNTLLSIRIERPAKDALEDFVFRFFPFHLVWGSLWAFVFFHLIGW